MGSADERERASSATDLVDVRLLQVPLRIWQRTVEHNEELAREVALIAQQLELSDARALPERLVRLVRNLHKTSATYPGHGSAELAAAAARGEELAHEIVYRVPPGAAEASRWVMKMLAEADEFCRRGEHLLTLASGPDVVAYRQWMVSEFERQIADEDPLPWPDYARAHGVVEQA